MKIYKYEHKNVSKNMNFVQKYPIFSIFHYHGHGQLTNNKSKEQQQQQQIIDFVVIIKYDFYLKD